MVQSPADKPGDPFDPDQLIQKANGVLEEHAPDVPRVSSPGRADLVLELFGRGERASGLDWARYEQNWTEDTNWRRSSYGTCGMSHTGRSGSDLLWLYSAALDLMEVFAKQFGKTRADAAEVLGKWAEQPKVPGKLQEPWIDININTGRVRYCGQPVRLQSQQILILDHLLKAQHCTCATQELPKGDIAHKISRIRSEFKKAAEQIKDETLKNEALGWSSEIIGRKEGESYSLTHPDRIRIE